MKIFNRIKNQHEDIFFAMLDANTGEMLVDQEDEKVLIFDTPNQLIEWVEEVQLDPESFVIQVVRAAE